MSSVRDTWEKASAPPVDGEPRYVVELREYIARRDRAREIVATLQGCHPSALARDHADELVELGRLQPHDLIAGMSMDAKNCVDLHSIAGYQTYPGIVGRDPYGYSVLLERGR